MYNRQLIEADERKLYFGSYECLNTAAAGCITGEGAFLSNAGQDTRQEIITVAMRYFSAMEYPMVNMEEIARDAHITRAPLYYYFRNKEGLYRAVVETSLANAKEQMESILNADENTFGIIQKEYDCCVHELGKYRKIWYPDPGAPDCQEQIRDFFQWLVNRKLEILSAAQRRGELSTDCDVSEIVTFIYVFYNGVLDICKEADVLSGFNHRLLENSVEWFMQMIYSRFG